MEEKYKAAVDKVVVYEQKVQVSNIIRLHFKSDWFFIV